MEIAVLLKQVPATESLIEISDDGTAIKTEGINWVMNPYDEMAVEEALQIRDDAGGTVTVFSLGPEKVVEALRTALAMGADTVVRIDPEGNPLDGLATAKVLAGELKATAKLGDYTETMKQADEIASYAKVYGEHFEELVFEPYGLRLFGVTCWHMVYFKGKPR